MVNFDNLIGLKLDEAMDILNQNGYKNINIINNYKHNDKCDSLLVCAVRECENEITLVCGEFYVAI